MKDEFSWKELKEFSKKGIAGTYFPNYVFKPWIFRTALGVLFLVLLMILSGHDWDFSTNIYIDCPEETQGYCENAYYKENLDIMINGCPDTALCEIEKFMPGETWGKKPVGFQLFSWSVLLLFAWAFIFNHWLYNKKLKGS